MRTVWKYVLAVLTSLYPAVHLGLYFQQAYSVPWPVTSNAYCSASGSSAPLVLDEGLGFGIPRRECRRLCAAQPDCQFYTYGRWTKGFWSWLLNLSQRFGGHYGEMRCQLYAECSVGRQQGVTVFQKPQPRELWPEVCVALLYLAQCFFNLVAVIEEKLISMCIGFSFVLFSGLTVLSSGVILHSGSLVSSLQASQLLVLIYFANFLSLLIILFDRGAPATSRERTIVPRRMNSNISTDSEPPMRQRGILFFKGSPGHSPDASPPDSPTVSMRTDDAALPSQYVFPLARTNSGASGAGAADEHPYSMEHPYSIPSDAIPSRYHLGSWR